MAPVTYMNAKDVNETVNTKTNPNDTQYILLLFDQYAKSHTLK